MSGLPLIPHFEIDPECCGCLCEVAADTTSFVCNEWGCRFKGRGCSNRH